MTRRILDVGQCGFDHSALSRLLETHFGAQVDRAVRKEDALQALRTGTFDLVLVNRILDSDGSSGIDVLTEIKADAELVDIPVMLVSNYADAQQQAIAAGAEPGFGKNELSAAETIAKLASVLSDD